MTYLQTIILAVVEGVTEFLPISSTGHLILTSDVLGIIHTNFVKSFSIFIQLGAILAVMVLYFDKLKNNPKSWLKILVAFFPTAVIGFLTYSLVKEYLLGSTEVVLVSLFIGGLALIILELWFKSRIPRKETLVNITYKEAFMLGLCQSVSIIPGVSRSAATIAGGLILGLKRQTAVEFSFILAIPTMLAATSLDLYKSKFAFTTNEYLLFGVGFGMAFLTALISIKFLVRFVQKHSFIIFGIYRLILTMIFAGWWSIIAQNNLATATAPSLPNKNLESSFSSLQLEVLDASASSQLYFDTSEARVPVRIPILTYHYIGGVPDPADTKRFGLSVTPDNFETQLAYLKDNGFTPLNLDEVYNIFDDQAPSPGKPVALTFDDGYMDFYYNAYPLLKKYHTPATAFIPTGLMNQSYYLTWDQIKEMSESGLVEFEAHTKNHPDLRILTYEEVQSELLSSKNKLEAETGQVVRFFAYPYGYYNKTVVTAARDAGFIGGITTLPGVATGKSLTIPRLNVNGYTTLNSFIEKITLN